MTESIAAACRNRRGAISVEWVGALVVCGVLVLALVVAAPGWAGALGGKVTRVVCAVTTSAVCASERARGEKLAETPTEVTAAGEGDGALTTFGAGGSAPVLAFPVGDRSKCMTVGGRGVASASICLGGGTSVAYCRPNASLGARQECKTARIPLSGTSQRCGIDPQQADSTVLVCGFRSADESTGALLGCAIEDPVAVTGSCVNLNARPAGPTPTDCFKRSSRTPIEKYGDEGSSSYLELCADAPGAVGVCTVTDTYDANVLRAAILGIDDYADLARIKPKRTERACSGSLVAGVADRLGVECGQFTTVNVAPCTAGERTIACVLLPDPDGRPTYHRCQDTGTGDRAGACRPGATTDPDCPAPPASDGTCELGASPPDPDCEPKPVVGTARIVGGKATCALPTGRRRLSWIPTPEDITGLAGCSILDISQLLGSRDAWRDAAVQGSIEALSHPFIGAVMFDQQPPEPLGQGEILAILDLWHVLTESVALEAPSPLLQFGPPGAAAAWIGGTTPDAPGVLQLDPDDPQHGLDLAVAQGVLQHAPVLVGAAPDAHAVLLAVVLTAQAPNQPLPPVPLGSPQELLAEIIELAMEDGAMFLAPDPILLLDFVAQALAAPGPLTVASLRAFAATLRPGG